jgi:hypothetical protein
VATAELITNPGPVIAAEAEAAAPAAPLAPAPPAPPVALLEAITSWLWVALLVSSKVRLEVAAPADPAWPPALPPPAPPVAL